MASSVETLTVDCADPRRVAEFWCGVLGYEISGEEDGDVEIRDPAGRGWPLLFQVVPEGKVVKNRLHLDLSPPSTMRDEVERVSALGATTFRLVEEAGSFWTVMLDPEGNEFCVLRGPNDDPPRERPT
ncbi:MAG TPA: VOC family protein [Actinomycetota bacterium]|nr:VOC family protein [Actinomycetota bacterium]